jgi:hypothetical protein
VIFWVLTPCIIGDIYNHWEELATSIPPPTMEATTLQRRLKSENRDQNLIRRKNLKPHFQGLLS